MSTQGSGNPSPPSRVTFAADIRPLFREKDRDAMRRAFDLWLYDDVVAHVSAIATKLHDGTMPCDGPWSEERMEVFDHWVDQGTPE